MILKCIVTVDFRFWLKCGKEIVSQNVIEQSIDENSDEYKKLCEEKETEFGFKRSDDVEKFDKKIMEQISDECKKVSEKRFNEIIETFKTSILNKHVSAYVNVGKVVIDLNDVAAIEANDFRVRIIKE